MHRSFCVNYNHIKQTMLILFVGQITNWVKCWAMGWMNHHFMFKHEDEDDVLPIQ